MGGTFGIERGSISGDMVEPGLIAMWGIESAPTDSGGINIVGPGIFLADSIQPEPTCNNELCMVGSEFFVLCGIESAPTDSGGFNIVGAGLFAACGRSPLKGAAHSLRSLRVPSPSTGSLRAPSDGPGPRRLLFFKWSGIASNEVLIHVGHTDQ